jgi:hypothetical protein
MLEQRATFGHLFVEETDWLHRARIKYFGFKRESTTNCELAERVILKL